MTPGPWRTGPPLREEENRPPGQPAGHRQRSDRPDSVHPRGQVIRARQMPGGTGSWCRGTCSRASRAVITSRAVAACSCPAGDRWATPRSAARHCPARRAPSPTGGALVEEDRAAAHGHCASHADRDTAHAAPAFQNLGRADRQSESRPAAASDAASRLIGLGVPLVAAGEGGHRPRPRLSPARCMSSNGRVGCRRGLAADSTRRIVMVPRRSGECGSADVRGGHAGRGLPRMGAAALSPGVDAAGRICEPLGTMSARRWRCCRWPDEGS